MPILITGRASDVEVVRMIARRNAGMSEIRCYLEEDDHELRNLGCKIALGSLTDDYTLQATLTNVHTFIPLLMDPPWGATDDDDFVMFGKTCLAAAAASEVERVLVPISGLPPPSGSLGDALAFIHSGFEDLHGSCILSCGFVWNDERDGPPPRDGQGPRILDRDLLVDVICAADDREETSGTWELGGTPRDRSDLEAWPAVLALLASAPELSNEGAEHFRSP